MNLMLKELEELMNMSTGVQRDAYKNALLIAIKYEKLKELPVQTIGSMSVLADQQKILREYEELMEMERRVMGEPEMLGVNYALNGGNVYQTYMPEGEGLLIAKDIDVARLLVSMDWKILEIENGVRVCAIIDEPIVLLPNAICLLESI